jgi:hypothetical protein
MHARYLVVAFLVGMSAPAAAQAPMNGQKAAAVFERIRTTPAELKMYCEQLKLRQDSARAFRNGDNATVSKLAQRIAEIQTSLPGYRDAVSFVSSKSNQPVYFKTKEGQALGAAQKQLVGACPAG